jgi:hypothetical protein
MRDSLAIAAKLAAADTTKGKKSRLSRMASKAVSASQKFEDVTGVSVKDVALAASGAGVGVLAAKKLGIDPTSLMSRASGQTGASQASMAGMTKVPGASSRASVAASGKASRIGMSLPTGMRSMPSMPSMPAGASMPGGRAMPPNAPYSDADMKMMQAFQTEMMRVSMAASQGDAAAETRLQRLQQISAKYEPEMERLSLRGTAADTAAVRRLVNIQVDIMREWMKDAPVAVKAVNTKPVRATKP